MYAFCQNILTLTSLLSAMFITIHKVKQFHGVYCLEYPKGNERLCKYNSMLAKCKLIYEYDVMHYYYGLKHAVTWHEKQVLFLLLLPS